MMESNASELISDSSYHSCMLHKKYMINKILYTCAGVSGVFCVSGFLSNYFNNFTQNLINETLKYKLTVIVLKSTGWSLALYSSEFFNPMNDKKIKYFALYTIGMGFLLAPIIKSNNSNILFSAFVATLLYKSIVYLNNYYYPYDYNLNLHYNSKSKSYFIHKFYDLSMPFNLYVICSAATVSFFRQNMHFPVNIYNSLFNIGLDVLELNIFNKFFKGCIESYDWNNNHYKSNEYKYIVNGYRYKTSGYLESSFCAVNEFIKLFVFSIGVHTLMFNLKSN